MRTKFFLFVIPILSLFVIFYQNVFAFCLTWFLDSMSDVFFEKKFLKIVAKFNYSIYEDIIYDRWEKMILGKKFHQMAELIFYVRPYPDFLFMDRIGYFIMDNKLNLTIDNSVLEKLINNQFNSKECLVELIDYIQCFGNIN